MSKSFYDEQSERVLLAAILCDGIDSLPPKVTLNPEFFSPPNRLIIEGALELYGDGKPCNLITVTDQLRAAGTLQKAGGPAAVSGIMSSWTQGESLIYVAWQELCALYMRREARKVVSTLTEKIDAGEDVEPILAEVERIGNRLSFDQRRGGLPKIENALACVQTPQPEPPQIIRGLLHKESKLVLGGGSKSYKTWCFCDMAVSVASGVPWWGFETIKSRVLYLNFELPNWSFSSRIQKISEAKGEQIDLSNLDAWNLRGHCADLSTLAPTVINTARKSSYGLIVLDPIYKCLGGRDENAAGDVGGLLNEIERIATETGAAVVFGAHFSKGNQAGKEAIDRISGSGVFARDPDAIVVLTPHEEPNAYTVDTTLRSLPKVEPFAVRWEFPLMHRDDQLDPAKLKQIAGRKRENSVSDILALLPAEGATTSEWQRLALDEEGISRPTFMRLRKEAEAARRIQKSPISGKWITR